MSTQTITKKPCCDCPITKQARDECMFNSGDEAKCRFFIQAHNMCMGYNSKEQYLSEIRKELAENPKTPAKKVCCSCPETKKVRDACLVTHGQEHEDCKHLIEAHKMCLRNEGFDL